MTKGKTPMKKFKSTFRFVAAIALFLLPLTIAAQETKREIHLKIVENGVVKKDTVYTMVGPASETDNFEIIEKHRSHDAGMDMKHKQVYIMCDSLEREFEWTEQNAQNKEVKVIMHKGRGPGENNEVEEIWIGRADEGKPCRTIIIHEGDCPGSEIHKVYIRENSDDHVSPAPPPPSATSKAGGKQAKTEKQVIKTDDGERVIIIETVVEEKENKKDRD